MTTRPRRRSPVCYQLLIVVTVIISNALAQAPKPQPERPRKMQALSAKQIVDRVSRSLASVEAQSPVGATISRASGFFIGKTNMVVTNLHVLKRASQANVKVLGENVTYAVGNVFSIDWKHDLCILELKGASVMGLDISQTDVEIGDDIYVAGNPRGLEGTFSKGIVSAVRSSEGLIQIDAAISHGSSGGPVVNTYGEVVGVAVSSVVGGQNLNFAIPVSFLKTVTRLKADVLAAAVLALTDAEADHLKGPVRSVSRSSAGFKYDSRSDREIEQPSILDISYMYDQNQLLQRITKYSDQGVILLNDQFEYGDDGIITTQVSTVEGKTSKKRFSPSEGIAYMSHVRPFSTTHGSELSTWLSTYTYDDDGNEVESIFKAPKGTRRSVSTFAPDGIKTNEKVYVDGTFHHALNYSYKFDRYGNWIEQLALHTSAKYPNLGPTPFEKVYREIKYY